MVKILNNYELEQATKLVNNEVFVGTEFTGQDIPEGNNFLDVMYITTVRIYSDGTPTKMLSSWSKVKGTETTKTAPKKKSAVTVNEGELLL